MVADQVGGDMEQKGAWIAEPIALRRTHPQHPQPGFLGKVFGRGAVAEQAGEVGHQLGKAGLIDLLKRSVKLAVRRRAHSRPDSSWNATGKLNSS